MNFENFLASFEEAKKTKNSFMVVTFVKSQGSAPQEAGSRMIVTENGYFAGTIGGGKLEKAAIEQSLERLKQRQLEPHFVEWNLQKDLGMSCGGVVSLFFEFHGPHKQWQIAIFGAGHVAQELVRVLLRLECELICIDPRSEWLDKMPKDPRLRLVQSEKMELEVAKLSPASFVVVSTMGHATDLPILEVILKEKDFPYVGAIGSEIKAQKLRQNLIDRQVIAEKANSFFCPIGDSFGNNTPPEIALSIASQLLKERHLLSKN